MLRDSHSFLNALGRLSFSVYVCFTHSLVTSSFFWPFLISSEEYDIEELKTVYDNFVLGNVRAPSHENPLQLSLVNNNSNTSTNTSNASIKEDQEDDQK